MLGTILIVVLILLLLGAIPAWPHSRGWGYYPSGGAGLILLAYGNINNCIFSSCYTGGGRHGGGMQLLGNGIDFGLQVICGQ